MIYTMLVSMIYTDLKKPNCIDLAGYKCNYSNVLILSNMYLKQYML